MSSLSGTFGESPKWTPKLAASKKSSSSSLSDINVGLAQRTRDTEASSGDLSIAELYRAARDENELLEFKNYELQFKIQELEQNQKRILSAICSNVTLSQPKVELAPEQQASEWKAHDEEDDREQLAPPTTNSSHLNLTLLEPTCGQLERQEQSRPAALGGQPNPLAGSGSRCATQQSGKSHCELEAELESGRVTSGEPADGARSASWPAQQQQRQHGADGHQFGAGSPHHAARHANESPDALLSLATGDGRGVQSESAAAAAARLESAKVDQQSQEEQLEQLEQLEKPEQLEKLEQQGSRLVEHENINNERTQRRHGHDGQHEADREDGHEEENGAALEALNGRSHDKYAAPMGEREDVARKTNRRSREPAQADRKQALSEHTANATEYNGDESPERRADEQLLELAAGQLQTDRQLPRGAVDASERADSELAVGAAVLEAGEASEELVLKSLDESGVRVMSKCEKQAPAPLEGAPKRPANARIAVPVQARRATTSQQQQQQNVKATGASSQCANKSISGQRRGPEERRAVRATSSKAAPPTSSTGPLRSRSKSSLEQKSVRRSPMSAAAEIQQQQHQRAASLTRAQSSRRVWSCCEPESSNVNSNSSSISKPNSSSPLDNQVLMRTKRARGQLSRASSSGQLSCSGKAAASKQQSGPFVTHIPTLIGASHALVGAARPLGSQSAMMRRIMTRGRRPAVATGTNQALAESGAKSKSLSNLVPNEPDEVADEADGESSGHSSSRSPNHVSAGQRAANGAARVPLESGRESSRSLRELNSLETASRVALDTEEVSSRCDQCASQQAQLGQLTREREQLREQLNELEELENDSRLMSQNLAQQLLAMEKRLEKCKFELARATESESKLRFQNKRLHFELRQRQDCIGQLQSQTDELRSRARALIRLQRDESPARAKQLAPTDCASGAKEQSQSQSQSQSHAPLAASSKSAGSSSAEDSDSTIDELEKRLALGSDHASATSVDSHQRQEKPLASAVSYDSAYSKSSSSSDANSSTNSEADCTEHCAQSSSCAASANDELDREDESAPLSSSLECDTARSQPACDRAAGSESVGRSAGGERAEILSARHQQDECATGCASSEQQERPESSCLLENIEIEAATTTTTTTDCVGHQEAGGGEQRQSAPLNRMAGPSLVQTDKRLEQCIRAKQRRSSIELALEGVNELEKARDRELEQFLAGQQRAPIPIKVAIVTNACAPPKRAHPSGRECEKVAENGIASELVATMASSQPDNEQGSKCTQLAGGQHSQLVDGLKRQVSSLKMRLVEANTLNDNLIRELKTQQPLAGASGAKGQQAAGVEVGERAAQQVNALATQHRAATTSCPVQLNNLAPPSGGGGGAAGNPIARHSWTHPGALMAARQAKQQDAAAAPGRRRSSVIYVNGLSASVTHHHHHYDRLQQQQQQQHHHHHQQQQQQTMDGQPDNNCINCCFHRHQTGDRYLPANMRQQQQQQLLDWLRFLLDKLHFHHGRTFELLSECQKFAMNALLASYKHQAGFLHHQRVVAAGNQAIRRAAGDQQEPASRQQLALQQQQQQQQQQQWRQHVATGGVVIENLSATMDEPGAGFACPVRPPPRRRASGNSGEPRDEMDAAAIQVAALHSPAGLTAPQVAKQTLSSLVPIYYLCNKQQQQQQQQNQQQQPPFSLNNGRQKLSLDLHARASQSASGLSSFEQPNNNNNNNISINADASHRPVEPVARPADIYATVNKAARSRTTLTPAVSVLEIGNARQDQQQHQQPTSSQLINGDGVNVVTIQARKTSPNPTVPINAAPNGVFKSINQQQRQLDGVRSSLSEDMERFRVHSNGQLLDLLMRQNWCESVISEKIRSMELAASSQMQHQVNATAQQPDCGLPNAVNNQ